MSLKGPGASVWDAKRLRMATDAAGVALWSWNVGTDAIALDERARNLWGVSKDEPVSFEVLSARIHPEDLDKVRSAFEASRALPKSYEIDFRIRHDDGIRWISTRGMGDDTGMVDKILFGVFLDVTERKEAEEARDLMAGEMSHRVKNLFALASSLTAIAARSANTTTEMARDLMQRLTALGRAHDLLHPAPDQADDGAVLLNNLLAALLAPYDDAGAVGGRIRISTPDVRVGQTAATTLALVVHEITTNSVKYGALSLPDGTLDISCTALDSDVTLIWTERGGPSLADPRGPASFGTKLITRSVSGQLGGSVVFDWPVEGAILTLRMSRARLAR